MIPQKMKDARQWIVWKSIPDNASIKPRKVPFYVDGTPRRGVLDSPDDQSRFGTYAQAMSALNSGAHAGLGFALCNGWQGVDLDYISERRSLDVHMFALCAMTYCEVSPNGDGIHAIGYGKSFDPIGSGGDGIEAYSAGRFFTVTGQVMSSAPITDLSFYIDMAIRPMRGSSQRIVISRPTRRDDYDLDEIRSALSSIPSDDRDTWQAVGHALCGLGDEGFKLWDEWSATSAKYNPASDHRTWLSFRGDKTGPEAIFAKAQACGWVNPKARKPLDTAAIGFGRSTVVASHSQPVPRMIDGSRLATPSDQVEKLFRGCVYIASENKILVPQGWLLDKQRFDNMVGGYSFIMNNDNAGAPSKSAWDAFLQNQAYECPKADTFTFRPELPAGCIIVEGGQRLANIWWPVDTLRTVGDVSPFLDHMTRLLPVEADRTQLLSYMAAVIQHPGAKFQWCPVVQGTEGNGKSFISAILEHAIGDRYSHKPNASELGSKFTGWLRGKLLVSVEEVMTGHKRETLDALKPLITNPRVEIQGKGSDQTTGDNRANFIMFTNHKNAIPVDVDKRRYAIYYTAQQSVADIVRDGMGGSYFPQLYNWARAGGYAHIAHYLANYAIPDELNPAAACHRAPHTSSTAEAISESLGALEQDIQECIESGEIGFRDGWVSTTMLTRKFEKRGLSTRRISTAMARLGYIHHPGLARGRCNNVVTMPDGNKPVLYVKPDHPSVGAGPSEIARMYGVAQSQFGRT